MRHIDEGVRTTNLPTQICLAEIQLQITWPPVVANPYLTEPESKAADELQPSNLTSSYEYDEFLEITAYLYPGALTEFSVKQQIHKLPDGKF